MIFGLLKSFNDYEEIRVSDLVTTYRYNAGTLAVSEDSSTIALAEHYVRWAWEGTPGQMHLIPSFKDNRVNVRTGDDWDSNTLLTDPQDVYGGIFRVHSPHDAGHVAASADGGVIASVNKCVTSDWSGDDPPVLVSAAGTLVIHYGSSWASVVRDHGNTHWDGADYSNTTRWGELVAVSADGSVVVVSEPEYEELIGGVPVITGRLHVYSGANWATRTILNNPVNDGGLPPVGYESTYMGDTALSVSSDGSKIIASLGVVREIENTWSGTPGASDYDAAEYWTSRAIIFSGSGWSTSTVLVADRTLMKTDHYHYSGGSFSHVSTAWSRWWGPASGASYQVPSMQDLDWSSDGSVVFWSDPGYQDDKGAVHVYSGSNWATHTIVTLSGTQSKQYSGTQYISTPTFYGSQFGSGVRCTADGKTFFALLGSSCYEFTKPSTSWVESGGTVLTDFNGGRVEIARGGYPVMLAPASSSNQWGTTWTRVDAYSYGFGAMSIIKRTQSSSGTARAALKRLAQPGSFTVHSAISMPYFKGMSIIKRSMTGSAGISAVKMPRFMAGAIRRRPVPGSSSLDAYVVEARRSRHSRGTPPHYGSDVDAVIALGRAIGVYTQGLDLHSVLTSIIDRIIQLEGKSRVLSPEFTAGAIFRRPVSAEVVQLAAELVARTTQSLSADSVLVRSHVESATVDALVYGLLVVETALVDASLILRQTSTASLDAVLFSRLDKSLSASSLLRIVTASSATANATKKLSMEPYGDMVRALNPLVWYRFSEAGGPFIDSGSVARNADVTGSPTRYAAGIVDDDSGTTFSGSEYGTTAAYTLSIGNVFTIEALIYPTSTGRRTIWSGSNTSGQFQLEIGGNGTDRLSAIVNGTFVAETNNNVITRNAWNHVVYRRSGTGSGTHRFWVNGVEQSVLVNSSTNYTDSNVAKFVGARVAGSQRFTGTIDEVVIYGSALDPVEIVKHYRALVGRMGLSSRAIIKATAQSQPTANSVIKKSASGSASANAVIS